MMTAAMCLALNMFFEARNESLIGQVMVAEVTLNRVANARFPDTVCEVVWQDKQFSWTHDGKTDNPNKLPHVDREAWRWIKVLADILLEEPEYLTKTGALYYHAEYVNPYWTDHYEHVATEGSHLFYK